MDTNVLIEPIDSVDPTEQTDPTKQTYPTECVICLLDLVSNSDFILVTPCCKNKFHNDCYNSWISKNPTCPLCRYGLLHTIDEDSRSSASNTSNDTVIYIPGSPSNQIYPHTALLQPHNMRNNRYTISFTSILRCCVFSLVFILILFGITYSIFHKGNV